MWSEVVIVVNVVLESAKTFANFILHTRLPCTVCCTVPFLEMQWNRGQTNSSSALAPRMKRAQQANLSPQRAAAAQALKIIFIPSLFFIDRVTHQPEWHYPNCESGGLTLLLIATKQNKQWKPLRKLLWSQWLHKHTELTHYFWQNFSQISHKTNWSKLLIRRLTSLRPHSFMLTHHYSGRGGNCYCDTVW